MTAMSHTSEPEPVFSEPWHAQVFAITVALNESGAFDWSEWADAFGATLKLHGLARDLNGGDDYWLAWLDALEGFLEQSGTALPQDTGALRAKWETAYQSTPHGQPVKI